jgi:hypothetical protein
LILICVSAASILAVVVNFVLATNTEYAVGYDEESFKALRVGENVNVVISKLGEPLVRYRAPTDFKFYYEDIGATFTVDYDGLVIAREVPPDLPNNLPSLEGLKKQDDLLAKLGAPSRVSAPPMFSDDPQVSAWSYSRAAGGNNHYFIRVVLIDERTESVVGKIMYWHRD